MKRPYQVAGAFFVLFAAFFIRESLELRFYTYLGPGPGFFPLWVSALIGLMGATMFYQATFRRTDPMPPDFVPSRGGYLRVGAIVLAMAGTGALIVPLGFRLTMLAFLMLLLFVLGRRGLPATLLVSAAGSFGMYHLFVEGLRVPLPIGIFGL